MRKRLLGIFFLLFTFSGFSGLIYESVWTHYLKLFLGHAAYAQALVLAIFMAGMAVGSWLCSRYSIRWKNLLAGYAIAEGIIGLFALVFHEVFDQIVRLSYNSIVPLMSAPVVIDAYKWTLSALLIFPQSVLLGMTFPLMTAGVLRVFPQRPGRSIAMLYFTNSIGGALGVLVSGFALIGFVGLPGTIKIAGVINIALGFAVLLLLRYQVTGSGFSEGRAEDASADNNRGWLLFLLTISLVTGAASFIYEIGWIRMLSLVLGSSTHAFELMLSAFIFGLAFGGLWIQRKLDDIQKPFRYLANVQMAMGILALATLLVYGHTFEVMLWMRRSLSRTDAGYALFNLYSNGIALAVMLPATFCAGMTLPLITCILLKLGHGERSIGAVYAWNTIGAIISVFFAIHIGMPALGLKGLITLGAAMDIAIGLTLIWSAVLIYPLPQNVPEVSMGMNVVSSPREYHKTVDLIQWYGIYENSHIRTVVTAICICAIAVTMFFVELDPLKMASGVYRGAMLTPANSRLLYHKDGKTATVSVALTMREGTMSLRTNGKADAGINIDPYGRTTTDEATMTLLAVIPMALNPKAEIAANIGFGSGLATHMLLASDEIKEVDTIEIERNILEASRKFGSRVKLAYTDPRSKVFIDDAKTFFSSHTRKYDIILSEPSNPWVSGVSDLYTEEFYGLISRHLSRDGLFVQWLQLYEIDMDLVASVMKAISSNFSDYVVYASNLADVLIVAKNNGAVGSFDTDLLDKPEVSKALRKIKIEGIQDIEIRKIGDKKMLDKLFNMYPIRANSDYYPILDEGAARARFFRTDSMGLTDMASSYLPVKEMLTEYTPAWKKTMVTGAFFFPMANEANIAAALRDYYLSGNISSGENALSSGDLSQATGVRRYFKECVPVQASAGSFAGMLRHNIGTLMVPYLRPEELDAVWKNLESGKCKTPLTTTEKNWISLLKAVGNRDAAEMVSAAEMLLKRGYYTIPDELEYIVAADMLGDLAQGKNREAYQLWLDYREKLFKNRQPNLLFRLLVAKSFYT